MLRKTALVTAMLGAFAGQAYAMGLGEIRLNSVLNQPLNAEIELLSPTATDIAELRVSLASAEAYTRAQVERAFFHTKLRFEVVKRPDGSAIIRITSREPVREPYLDFLLEATWGSGQVLREYTVLVDPPALMPAPAPVTRAPTAAAPAPVSRAPSRPAAIPSGFSGNEYRTSRNDTLWQIAAEVRPDSSLSMEQTMLGLLEANPDAFYDQNINNLKAGHVLRVPSAGEISAVSQRDALAEVRRQNRLWREGRTAATRAPAVTAAAPAAAGSATGVPTPAPDAQLKLVAPETGEPGTGGEGNTDVQDLRKDLTLAVEAVEAQRQENQELNTRLQELEAQIAKLHRLIELKDGELAQLGGTAVPAIPGSEAPVPDAQAPAAVAEAAPETAMPDADASAAVAVPEAESADAEPGIPAPEAMDDVAAVPESDTAEMAEAMPEPAPAVPAPTPVEQPPVEASEDEGLLATIMANPLYKWGAAGGAVLIALLAWLGLRRRGTEDSGFQESILAHAGAAPAAAGAGTAGVAAAAASAAPASAEPEPAPAEAAPDTGTQTDSSLFTDFSVSDLGAIQDEEEADPIAEADVYLAYGRYQQAEELVRSAVTRSPQRNDLKLKLLEVLFAAKNSSGFDAEAEALLAGLDGQDDEIWQRVAEMGQELSPSNPMYREGGSAAAAASAAAVATAAVSQTSAEPAQADDAGLDFDLGAGDSAAADVSTEDLDLSSETQPEMETDNSLDFDMGELESFSKSEAEPSMPVEDDLSFDLSAGEAAEEEEAGEGALDASDEVSTKLDLARAYMEMGDPDGARSILEEVLEEGNDAQKSEAQSLLQKVS